MQVIQPEATPCFASEILIILLKQGTCEWVSNLLDKLTRVLRTLEK